MFSFLEVVQKILVHFLLFPARVPYPGQPTFRDLTPQMLLDEKKKS
jgi:hypothetical protein